MTEIEFGALERRQAEELIALALAEDLPAGDATTDPLFRPPLASTASELVEAVVATRSAGVVCGLPLVQLLFAARAPDVRVELGATDGDAIDPTRSLAVLRGPAATIFRLERTMLNFVQRLSGIATMTRRWAEQLEGSKARLLDTRKTTPGWRYLEKYAVRCGGGQNHRLNLSDGVLIKDNHLGVLRRRGLTSFDSWVPQLRQAIGDGFLEVEVDTVEDACALLGLAVDAILLDNFSLADLRRAVAARDAAGRRAPLLEASGGVSFEQLAGIAATGIDRISVGALTHSAPSLDIGLDLSFAAPERA